MPDPTDLPESGSGSPVLAGLTVLSGPAAAGKSAVVQAIGRRCPAIWPCVAATTREPRPGETHGIGHVFVTRAEFDERAAAGHVAYPLGISIGKSKVSPLEDAVEDYVTSLGRLCRYGDYCAVDVSSPNTPGLRDLQAVDKLRPLLRAVRAALDEASPRRRVPLLVKIAPDLADTDIDAVADLALDLGLDGIIATNTTISREGLRDSAAVADAGPGGMSGAPLKARALAVLRRRPGRVGDRLVLVAAPQALGERLAFQVLHHQEVGALLRPDVIEMADVGMIQAGDGPRLALEALLQIRVGGEVLGQHLDGHGALQPRVARAIDFAHPARARRPHDLVGAQFCSCGKCHRNPSTTNSDEKMCESSRI